MPELIWIVVASTTIPGDPAVKRLSSSGLHWLVKLRNGVISALLQGGAEHVQNKQDN